MDQNGLLNDIFFNNRIRCRKCYAIFATTEYYKQCIVNKISDAYNKEYDADLEKEFEYFIRQINIQCHHSRCIII